MTGEPIDPSQAEAIRAEVENTFGLKARLRSNHNRATLYVRCPHAHYADHVWDGLARRLSAVGAIQDIRVLNKGTVVVAHIAIAAG